MPQFITLAVQQDGPARTENHEDRPHRVIPAVMVQEQVLHNNLGRSFLPAADITDEWARTSNMAPVLVDHPSERGAPIPARGNRKVQNAMRVGFTDNVFAVNGRLKGEVWLDEARAQSVSDLKVILEKLDRGETVELSTGFPAEIEETKGVHNGKDYDIVIHPGPMDHLAVFAEKRGACSVTDGCGLGVNHEGDCEPEPLEIDGVTITVPPGETGEGLLKKLMNAARSIAGLKEPEAPETTPPAQDPGTPPQENTEMNREQMIAQLAEAGRDTEVLNKLSDCDLKALLGAASPSTDPPVNHNGANDPNDETWQARFLAEKKEREALQAKAIPAMNREDERRADMLADLLYKGKTVAWSEQELKAMDNGQLEKIHRQVFNTADWSGQGGPRSTTPHSGGSWVKPMHVVLTEKGVN